MASYTKEEFAQIMAQFEDSGQKITNRPGFLVSPEHQQTLEAAAAELGVDVPFARYEHTRF